MNKIKLIISQFFRYLLAIFMVYAGIMHFLNPVFYVPFVPEFLPFKAMIISLSGFVEVALGLTLFCKANFAKFSALGVFLLMIIFLPIHIRDVFVENPAIGNHQAALIRLTVQFVFMGWAYFVFSFLKRK